ncbi:MAG: thioredoxin [candidate division WOR-3 bacterium]
MNEKELVLHLTDANFDNEVNNSTLPVLVDFWAPWCGPCRMLAPVLEQVAQRYAGKIVVGKVNVDENPNVTGRFGILSIPTLIFFKAGKEIERIVGAMPEPALSAKIDELLK